MSQRPTWASSRSVSLAAGLAVLAAACGGASGSPSSTPSQAGASSSPVPAVSPASPAPVPSASPQATFDITENGGFAFVGGCAWTADGNTLLRIDPTTNETVAKIQVGPDSKFLYVAEGSVWVNSGDGFYRVDPTTNQVTARLPNGGIFGYGSLWSTDASGSLLKIDASTGKIIARTKVQGPVDWSPQLAVGFGSVWVGSGDEHQVIRVDPQTGKVAARIGGISKTYSLLAVGTRFGSVWAQANAAAGSGILYRIDPDANKVIASIHVGEPREPGQYGGTDVAFGDGSVWTADASPTVTRVDPRTNRVVATLDVGSVLGGNPNFIAVGYHSVWVSSEEPPLVARFDAGDWSGS